MDKTRVTMLANKIFACETPLTLLTRSELRQYIEYLRTQKQALISIIRKFANAAERIFNDMVYGPYLVNINEQLSAAYKVMLGRRNHVGA